MLDVLPPADAELAMHLYGLTSEGNYLDDHRKRNGENILHIAEPLDELAQYKRLNP